MPRTNLLSVIFPAEDQNNFFEVFKAGMNQFDNFVYSSLENPNIILNGGGVISLDTGTDTLSWTEDIELLNMMTGGKVTIEAGSLAGFTAGKIAYVEVARPINGSIISTLAVADTVGIDTSKIPVALRRGNAVFMKNDANRSRLFSFSYFSASKIVTANVSAGGGQITGQINLGISQGVIWRLRAVALSNTVDASIEMFSDVALTNEVYSALNKDCYTSVYEDRTPVWVGIFSDGVLHYRITNDGANDSIFEIELSGFGEGID